MRGPAILTPIIRAERSEEPGHLKPRHPGAERSEEPGIPNPVILGLCAAQNFTSSSPWGRAQRGTRGPFWASNDCVGLFSSRKSKWVPGSGLPTGPRTTGYESVIPGLCAAQNPGSPTPSSWGCAQHRTRDPFWSFSRLRRSATSPKSNNGYIRAIAALTPRAIGYADVRFLPPASSARVPPSAVPG